MSAEMIVETTVLHRQQRVDEMLRYLLERDRPGDAAAPPRKRLPVIAVQHQRALARGLKRRERIIVHRHCKQEVGNGDEASRDDETGEQDRRHGGASSPG